MQAFMDGIWRKFPIEEYFVWDLLANISEAGRAGKDVAANEILDQAHPWYPLMRHWCQMMYSMDPENVSTGDAGNYSDSGMNLPVKAGYGALIAKMARKLPVSLNIQVTAVEALANTVRVETSAGMFESKACIVAVPARQMEIGKIAFKPGLPEHLKQAFRDVPMGWFEKVAIAFDRAAFEGFENPFADIFDPVAARYHALEF